MKNIKEFISLFCVIGLYAILALWGFMLILPVYGILYNILGVIVLPTAFYGLYCETRMER